MRSQWLYMPYLLLSAAFIIVNVTTLGNQAPWIDEVMFLDVSYNAAVHGSWDTTAWYRVAGQYPFPTYPPLYQLLATVWIWLFGSGMVTVRSLNLLITLMLGVVCLRLMRHRGLPLSPWTTALFTVLLWGSSEMACIYRNGRPDMLCALMSALTLQAVDSHLSAKSAATRIAVIATSALLLCSGIQAAVYFCVLCVFVLVVSQRLQIYTRDAIRARAVRLLALLLTGFLLGLLLVSLFMLAHGRLVGFVSSIVQYSATLSHLALGVLPWAGKVFGFSAAPYTQKLLELNTEPALGQRLASIADAHSFVLLSVLALAVCVVSCRCRLRKLLSDKVFLTLLFALCVPVAMNMAGRFAVYYRWMAFLPLAVGVTAIAARRRLWCGMFGAVAVGLAVAGVRSMMPGAHWDSANLYAFVQRQHFKPTDAVVCPFSVFYEMKPVCDTCYFAGIFPTEYIGHVDYIIEPTDGEGLERRITDYIRQLQADTTVVLTVADRCERPSLTLYKVRSRKELSCGRAKTAPW